MEDKSNFLNGFTSGSQFEDGKTMTFSLIKEKDNYILSVLSSAYDALSEKGYNPVNQMVGYLMSGDPTYITANKDARKKVLKFSREELLEAVIRHSLR